jgi:hypothetical protein
MLKTYARLLHERYLKRHQILFDDNGNLVLNSTDLFLVIYQQVVIGGSARLSLSFQQNRIEPVVRRPSFPHLGDTGFYKLQQFLFFVTYVESIPAGVCQILKPAEARCFLVNIVLVDLETGFREIAAVPIPNPTDSGWKDLENLREVLGKFLSDKTPVLFGHADQYSLQTGVLVGYKLNFNYLYALLDKCKTGKHLLIM